MAPYIATTVISTLLVYIEERLPKRFNKRKWLSLLSIIILCVLAGARDNTVGTDTLVYGESLFTWVHNNDLSTAFLMNTRIQIERGYMLFIYIISRFTDQVFWNYFFIEFVCAYFTYKALDDAEIGKNKWIGVFLYNVLFYSFTMNLMRQCMAMAIVLFGFKYVRENKFWKYLITCLIAFMFHSSAIIGISIYFLYKICGLGNSGKQFSFKKFFKKYKFLFIGITIIASAFIVIFSRQLMLFVVIFKPSYAGQIAWAHNYNPAIAMLVLMLVLVLPLLISIKWIIRINPHFTFYLLVMIMSVILWQLAGVSSQTFRITLYYWYLIILIIPELVHAIKSHRKKLSFSAYYVVFGSFYYWFVFVYSLMNYTYPYTSKLLGISP